MNPPRLAGHLGVRAPDAPLLRGIVGSADPIEQIALLADLGFAGVSDNYLALRPPDVQARIGAAAADHGLEMGGFVHDPLRWDSPAWIDGSALDALDATLAAAARCGSRTVTCVTGRLPAMDLAVQYQAMAGNLARAADRAGRAGVTLCVEPTHPAFAPGLLIERLSHALIVVRAADHPFVRIDLDLGHVALHGEDPVAAIAAAGALIAMVQIADVPGRVEPGAGTLDWHAIFAALGEAGFAGLAELELEPAAPGAAGERAMLARLARLGLLQKEKPTSIP
ncbi:hydroxypyruvate isomerase [Sphingomonas zeicaulis]|uniref:TIM barrel protein n=1 Tax=Sphingomonas zeicaulis TaxID=1632740 RepID=UPI003D21C0CC